MYQRSIGMGYSLHNILRVPEIFSAENLHVVAKSDEFAFLVKEAYVNCVDYREENKEYH